MAKEIPLKLIIGALSHEKGVSEELIFQAVEAALVSATKKKFGLDMDARVTIDRKTGCYETFRVWTVVADLAEGETLEHPLSQLVLSEAVLKNPALQVNDAWEEPIESVEFGRIEAQTARQVIFQKVREAERENIASEYRHKQGQLVTGTVKRTTREAIYLDLPGNAEAILEREEMLPREAFRMGDRLQAYLREVTTEPRGPQVILSRTCPEMLIELFKREVPEVGEGIIEIKGAARDPGMRAKIAVKTNDGRIDPVGACVGIRGTRVQAVSNELCGERVDIILWHENPAQFAMNAMAPAEISSIVVDEDALTMDLAVNEAYYAQAIGRGGQNVRLASQLTGWTLNVVTEKEALAQTEAEQAGLKEIFTQKLAVDEDVADVLISEGLTSLEEVAYVPLKELLAMGFDEETVGELRRRAKDALLAAAIASDDQTTHPKPAVPQGLLEIPGMTEPLAALLTLHGIATRDDLAEQAVDDLLEISELTKGEAAELIMAARAHWFE